MDYKVYDHEKGRIIIVKDNTEMGVLYTNIETAEITGAKWDYNK